MKNTGRKKKAAAIGTATLAGVLCASLLFQSILSVKASPEMMPGIETIVNSKSLKVLELVSDYSQAEIGAYVKGQEPWIKLYQQKKEDDTYEKAGFTSLEDGLSRLKTKEEREAFASAQADKIVNGETKRQFQDFDTSDIVGDPASIDPLAAPLSYIDYAERYFLTDEEDAATWKEVSLAADDGEIRTVELKGSYEPAADGIGDYTRDELIYFPVAEKDTEGKAKAEYVENIYGFTYQDSGTGKPYDITFKPVSKTQVEADIAAGLELVYDYENGQYGYYENVYAPVTESQDETTDVYFSGSETEGFIPYLSELQLDEKLKDSCIAADIEFTQNEDAGPLTVSILNLGIIKKLAGISAQYIVGNAEEELNGYVQRDEAGTFQHVSFVENEDGAREVIMQDTLYIQGLQMVSQDAVSEKAYDGYYHQVDTFGFSCTREEKTDGSGEYEYKYNGNYAALYPLGGERYKQVDMGTGNYFVSDPVFTLTPDKGTFDFVENEDGKDYQVQIDHIYYQGGFTNHDWLKRFPLHLDPGDGTGNIQETESVEAVAAKEQFEGFEITVDTMTAVELDEAAKALWQAENPDADESGYTGQELKYLQSVLKSYSVVYLNGAISETQSLALFAGVSQIEYPLLVNSDTILSADKENQALGETQFSVNLALWLTADEAGAVGSDLLANNNLSTAEIDNQLGGSDSKKSKEAYEADRHFVKQNVYYFGGGNQAGTLEGGNSVGFVNKYMNTEFLSTLVDEENFKEISDYIEEENKLRDIENASKKEEDKYPPLEETISMARGMEYVLNYKYKRTLGMKGTIKVLDLEPAKSGGGISEIDILDWLGYKSINLSITKETGQVGMGRTWYCCDGSAPGSGSGDAGAIIQNICDGDPATIWHSAYNQGKHEGKDDVLHFFIVDMGKQREISQIMWQNRTTGNGSPFVKNYRISISDTLQGDYTVIEEDIFEDHTKGGVNAVIMEPSYKGQYVKFEVLSGGQQLASCSEFKIYESDAPKIQIDTMTTSEFVGKTGDLNAEYDMIFMGSDTTDPGGYIFKKKKNMGNKDGRDPNKDYPVYNETAMDGMVYTHVGDVMEYKPSTSDYPSLTGLMETDYLPVDLWADERQVKKRYLYSKELFGLRTHMVDGKYVLDSPMTISTEKLLKGNSNVVDSSQINADYKFTIGNLGYFRRSGNDITDITVRKLMDFVKSGYPVIAENDLYLLTDGIKEANKSIVDNSSCVYDFLEQASGYSNVKTRGEVSKSSGELKFYLNLPKINFEFEDGESGMPPIYVEGENKMIDTNDKALRFSFKIKDDAIISHETEKYDCKLFVDLNTDGNFAKGEQIPDIEVRDENGNLVLPEDGVYSLSTDTLYHVSRVLPDEFREVISWKIQAENNRNSYMRCSQSGISKIRQTAEEGMSVKVLQITPVEGQGDLWSTTKVNLRLNDEKFLKILNSETVTDSLGFGFDIQVLNANDYSSKFDAGEDIANPKKYDMLVIGFADGSSNIISDKAVQAIYNFIDSGKSVLYAHDSASFTNYSNTNTFTDKSVKDNAYGEKPYWHNEWGYKVNSVLRTVAGMDRYGIVSKDTSSILKKNNILSSTDDVWSSIQGMTYDMAYVAGTNNKQSYGETQGYSNVRLDTENPAKSYEVTQVNKGAITEYPYKIDTSFPIELTHGQYYQLSMEQDENKDGESDVVVWYCLSDEYYSKSPNDVRNNYYIYSKENVMYTGVGHSVPNEEEMKLFVNTIVAAYHSSVSQPSVDFIERNDLNAGNQSYVYYSTNATEDVSGNILDNQQNLYFKVNDKNIVNSGEKARELKLNLYKKVNSGGTLSWEDISGESSESTELEYIKLGDDIINGNWGLNEKGDWIVTSGNVYEVNVPNLEKLLRTSDGGYINGQEIYVTISGSINSYGKDVKLFASDVLTFRKQQLLNMD